MIKQEAIIMDSMEHEKEQKKRELQKEFFKRCHEEGFTFSEMYEFDNYVYALMDYADEELTLKAS